MRIVTLTIFALLTTSIYSQEDPYRQWDLNYLEVNLEEIIDFEIAYADSIESNYGDSLQFYYRADKYRFEAVFTGNWRKISDKRKADMHTGFALIGVDQTIVSTLKKEVEIKLDSSSIWLPIQPQLEKPFRKEVPTGSKVYIYAFFLNMHSLSNGLTNILLLSEFISEF